jgi:lipid II:glycine glycyltransferase (peptidoglycan interpeptide bridge formation enzyme)
MTTDILLKQISLDDFDGKDNLLQSAYWGRLKAQFGWEAFAFRFDHSTLQNAVPFLVLVRRFKFGYSLAYFPHGPEIPTASVGTPEKEELLEELSKSLREYLPNKCLFLRFDLPWAGEPNGIFPLPLSRPFFKAPVDIQPASTVLLDLTDSEEEILLKMKSKSRYNVRLALKKGVNVCVCGKEKLDDWYEMYKETAKRDRIVVHSLDYYRALFTTASEHPVDSPVIHLLMAEIDGVPVAGIILALHGHRATYLFGASTEIKRNYMPAFALQWEAIRLAKAGGCTAYDLYGIPPNDNPSHPMHGLYRFKVGFGGEIEHRQGCWDFPYIKPLYSAYRLLEKSRQLYFKKYRRKVLQPLILSVSFFKKLFRRF